MAHGAWLSPGPLRAKSLDELRDWLARLDGSVSLVALGPLELDGTPVDPFAMAAGLSALPGLPALGVAAMLDGRRLPTVIGRELIALDHVSAGLTGLVLGGATQALDESARILEAMLRGDQVVGGVSAAMPADFSFENRPGPVTPGGPTVVLVDPEAGARPLGGETVTLVTMSDHQLREARMGALGPDGHLLVTRGAAPVPMDL